MPSRASTTSTTRRCWNRLARFSGSAFSNVVGVGLVIVMFSLPFRGSFARDERFEAEAVPPVGRATRDLGLLLRVREMAGDESPEVAPRLSIARTEQDDGPVAGEHQPGGAELLADVFDVAVEAVGIPAVPLGERVDTDRHLHGDPRQLGEL